MHIRLTNILADLTATLERVSAYTVDPDSLLKTSPPNAKTKHMLAWLASHKKLGLRPSEFASLSLLSGVSCPGAKDCKATAVPLPNGKRTVKDGTHCRFRCFSASNEAQYDDTYLQRKHNRDQLLACGKDTYRMLALLLASVSPKVKLIRIHIGGDFFSLEYMLAWIAFAALRPNTRVYGYTKSLHFLARLDCAASDLPSNLKLVLSHGGMFDHLIPALQARGYTTTRVVFDPVEADRQGLAVDHNDSLAAFGGEDFALVLHAVQPEGSEAAKALARLHSKGDNGYSKKHERV